MTSKPSSEREGLDQPRAVADHRLPSRSEVLSPSSVPDELESVRILRLQPGDEIVLRVDGRGMGQAAIEQIKQMAEERWPGHRITVVDRIDIEVVRA